MVTPELLLVANRIAGDALSALVQNHQRGRLRVVAATMRRPGELNRADFADLGALTGARVLDPALGETLRSIGAADLGSSERVKASATALTVINRRDADPLRTHIAALRAQIAAGYAGDDAKRTELRQRIGRLSGGVATLKIGAATAVEAAVLRQRAAQGIGAITSALRDGLAPGMVALLACAAAAAGATRARRGGLRCQRSRRRARCATAADRPERRAEPRCGAGRGAPLWARLWLRCHRWTRGEDGRCWYL